MIPSRTLPYASIIVKLLKGTIEYLDKSTWQDLLQYKIEINNFLPQLGLTLVLNEDDGYAFLKQNISDDDSAEVTWFQRRSFTYEETIMLVLLRELMAEFEISESSARELIKRRREIKDHSELFFKEDASRVRFLKEIDRLIDKAEDNGFLEMIEDADIKDEQKFRIKKIIKEKVNIEILEQFTAQLSAYKNVVQPKEDTIDSN
ncbi:DUF4194 domain-containing protein [Sediminibacterium ginsengisoli]|uniref:DUF4194 domain-containing protein n=1 Tax=Sediminibacterium ginsengisoli TaxID=413434 RepID=A0A1T4P154_9BACT|nr:DUF4194 domain-containing protein [Sediminibacterium ginsengisoli]SJZ84986.1 protein of unknown function [Sediminibacterium ginsengisoli]